MTTLTWVKDADGNHEVSSPEHLIQIMHAGAKFTDAGDAPISSLYYGNATTKYLQTVDIDLANYHEHIVPIAGTSATYDGGNHSIANWEYHSTGTGNHGLVGTLSGPGVFKNVRLTGVWKISGNGSDRGFVAGYCMGSIDNVTANFEPGTEITGTSHSVGAFAGFTRSTARISGCTLNGTLDLTRDCSYVGGMVGYAWPLDMTLCANFANFPKGISTQQNGYCGGIVGIMRGGTTNFHSLINAMKGDIGGELTYCAGGIVAKFETKESTPPTNFHTFVNVMLGKIECKASGGGGSGGIIGWADNKGLVVTKAVNYMTGNIFGNRTGGLIARISNTASTVVSLTNSIIAMNGNVPDDAVTKELSNATDADLRVTVNTEFGLTFATNNYASTDALVDFVTDDVFTLLPYIPLSGTSEQGATISFDPVFGNLSGLDPASPFAQHQTLTIHTSPEIYYPAYVNMGFSDTNTTKYLTYGDVSMHKITLHVDDTITGPFTGGVIDSVFNTGGALVKGLEWTQNGSGEYEVSTPPHLVQLMSNGAVYDDVGTPPTYMTSNFAQTSDINLFRFRDVIEPIGAAETPFSGGYSGSMYAISEWNYGRGTGDDGTGVDIGLFGTVDGGSITGLKLTGKWSMAGSCDTHGFVVGKLMGTSTLLSNIEADFAEGTLISSGHATSSSTCGVLVGSADGDCTLTGLNTQGHVSYQGTDSVVGGMIGSVSGGASLSWAENSLTFTDGLGGSSVTGGGIVGKIGDGALKAFHLSNNSSGTLTGSKCGGIVGSFANGAEMTRVDTWANAMTGDIVGSVCAGGIVGEFEVLSAQVAAVTKVTNYMCGNITSTASGGVIGKTVDGSNGAAAAPAIQCTNSIVAMKGTVGDTAVGDAAGHLVDIAINVNSDFGVVYTTNTHETTDALTGYETLPGFPLPFLAMTGTESGLSHDRKALFPNIRGVGETSPLFGYDVAVIHSHSTIYVPFMTEFDFVPDGTRYITYAILSKSELFVDPSVTVLSSTALYTMDYNGNAKLGFLPAIDTTTAASNDSKTPNMSHSFTDYKEDDLMFCTRNMSHAGVRNPVSLTDDANAHPIYAWVRALGIVFNRNDDHAYFVLNDDKTIRKQHLDTGRALVHDDAVYNTIVGDSSFTYMFGSRQFGGVHQVYRMDMDGSNMITANVSDLLGENMSVYGFASNRDDERIYFSDTGGNSYGTVYSLSWDLDDIQEMPITLRNTERSDLAYHQGMLYFGNKDPVTGVDNNSIYAYDLAKGGFRSLGFSVALGTDNPGRRHMYVHAGTKSLIISNDSGTGRYVGTNFDFHKEYITMDRQYTDGFQFSWLPIDGATSYRVEINGVADTTADTVYTSRGHVAETMLEIKISYSTDGATYHIYKYASRSLTVKSTYFEKFVIPGMPLINAGSATWADPYENPHVALCIRSNVMYTYDVVAKTFSTVNARGMMRMDRCPTTKDIIASAYNAHLYNAGENATHITNDTMPAPFYTHTSRIDRVHCSHSGLVYFIDANYDVWSVGLDGTGAQLVVSPSSNCVVIATDTHSPEKLVYNDGWYKLMYLNLSTNVTTEIYSGFRFQDMRVVDETVYVTSGSNQTFTRVRLDGTVEREVVLDNSSPGYGYGILVDSSRQKVILFKRGTIYEFNDTSHTIPSLPADSSSMIVSVTPLGMRATWSPIEGATSYKIGISPGSDGENAATIHYTTSDTTELDYTHSLAPETTHSVYLTYDTASETDLLSSFRTINVPAVSTDASDYNKEFFRGKGGRFDLTKVRVGLGPVLADLFESGDSVQIKLRRGKRFPTAKIMNPGDTVKVKEVHAVLLPFEESAGSYQTINLQLSDGSTSSVLYNETDETITIDSGVYSVGDYTVIDNQKVSVYEY